MIRLPPFPAAARRRASAEGVVDAGHRPAQHFGGVRAPGAPTLSTNWSDRNPVVPPNTIFSQVESGPAGPLTVSPVAMHSTCSLVPPGTTPTAVADMEGEARNLTF